MGIVVWVIFGAISGWIASLIMKTDANQNMLMDIILGILGAIVGGYIFGLLGLSGVTGFDIYSLFVSVFGAIVVIFIGRKLRNG